MSEQILQNSGMPEGEKRESAKKERELNNIPAIASVGGQIAAIHLINERLNGLGAVISETVKKKLQLEIGQKITVKARPNAQSKEKQLKVEVVNVREIPNKSRLKKYQIGLKYTDDNAQKFTLNDRSFTAS